MCIYSIKANMYSNLQNLQQQQKQRREHDNQFLLIDRAQ